MDALSLMFGITFCGPIKSSKTTNIPKFPRYFIALMIENVLDHCYVERGAISPNDKIFLFDPSISNSDIRLNLLISEITLEEIELEYKLKDPLPSNSMDLWVAVSPKLIFNGIIALCLCWNFLIN